MVGVTISPVVSVEATIPSINFKNKLEIPIFIPLTAQRAGGLVSRIMIVTS